jgi:osmotically inducible lipoprotein OsmB
MEVVMKSKNWLLAGLLLSLAGCASMSEREKCLVGGAAIGGVAGSVLSEGSGIGTVGGAAVGGYIGSELGRDRRCP